MDAVSGVGQNAIDDWEERNHHRGQWLWRVSKKLIVRKTSVAIGTNYPGTARTGLYVARLTNAVLSQNQFYDCEGYGFYGRNLTGVSMGDSIFEGNPLGTHQPALGHSGIVVDDSVDGNVDCTFFNNRTRGFRARSMSLAAIVRTKASDNHLVGVVSEDDGSAAGTRASLFWTVQLSILLLHNHWKHIIGFNDTG